MPAAQDSEAATPGANEGFQLVGLLQLSSVGQEGYNFDLAPDERIYTSD